MIRPRKRAVLIDAKPDLARLDRRLFLRNGLSLGALTLLTGCDLTDGDMVDKVLWAMSRWNDKVQAFLFDQNRLAPTYGESDITTPFPFNAFYSEDDVPDIDGADWKLEVSGLVSDKSAWTLERLRTLPQESQITRHICIEGWSAIGHWSGVPFRTFLERIGADLKARYVGFKCADRYYSSLDMATAL
ncbi:MAG TPA: molybdopterin-dependent oxidoreductase, partial [Aliidongia sp.]|uniref:molybdopterin-dependent oxidoreductase n=1 Tax=Aliidongia sp. TaxID=1914230 RepID=UPI002DDCD613